ALARAAKPHYSGPNQSFIELPNANHAVIAQSASTDATKPTCGSTLVVSWLGSALRGAPHADESCIPSIASPRFDWSTAVLTRVFGVPSAWGDGS
ncbi:MAG: hypothetical protein ACXWUG_17050, partial [Polyangiales bacterium]